MTTDWKNYSLTRRAFVGKVISAFSYAVQVCHSFPSKEQVSLNFTAAVTICSDSGAQENKICHYFHFSPSICHEVTGLDAIILFFPMLSFKPASPLSPFTLIKRLFTSSSLSAIRVVSSAYLKLWYFSQQPQLQLVTHPAQHFTWCTLHISQISRVTVYSLVVVLSQFWTSQLFHVQF